MPEDAAARLVQDEVPKGLILGNESRLLPDRVTRRRYDTADNDVADLAGGMAADDMNDFGRSQEDEFLTYWKI